MNASIKFHYINSFGTSNKIKSLIFTVDKNQKHIQMKKYIYRVGSHSYNNQVELAYALDMNIATLKSKIQRAGGRSKVTSLEIKGHNVQIVTDIITKLV